MQTTAEGPKTTSNFKNAVLTPGATTTDRHPSYWLTLVFGLTTALVLLNPSSADAQTQTYPCETVIQIGTGTSTNGAKLRPGSVDPSFHGTDATFPDPPNTYVVTDPPSAWIDNSASADSQWIGPSPSTADDVAGTSVYRLIILSPCAGATLTGRYAASDRGMIGLNGTINNFPTPATGSTAWTPFSFNNLLPGINRLEFYVTNSQPVVGGPPGPSGLRAELTVTATCCPCIVLDCPSDIFLTTCSNGAPANFSITGTNRCFTNLNINCSLASPAGVPVSSGYVFPVGTNNVICTASDTAGHRTNCSFRVTVARDSQAPQIRCPQDIIYPCSVSGTNVFYNVTATDDTVPAPVVNCVPPSGSFFRAGTNTVVCEARDLCGNIGRCSFRVVLAPDGFTKTLQAGVADNFALNDFEPANPGPCLGTSGYWTGMPFDTYFPGRHLSHSFEGLPDNLSAATLILHMKPRLTTSQDDMLHIGLQNCGGAGVWAFAQAIASLPGAGGTWVTNPPTTFALDLTALPGGVNLLAGLNANHRLEFAVGTETLVDYARLEVTYCGPQSMLSGVPYSLNNVRPIHQGDGISWRVINSNGPPPTISLDVGQSDGIQFHFDTAFGSLPICPNPGGQLLGYEGASMDWPTGNGTMATAAITESVIPGLTRLTMSQPWNTIGKAIEVWNAGQLVARYYLAGTGDTRVNAPSDACLFAMGFGTGYFFANFHDPISVQFLTGQHVSGPTGGIATGDSIRLYYALAVGPPTTPVEANALNVAGLTTRSDLQLRVTPPPGGMGVAGISLRHDNHWVKAFGPQQLTVSDVAISKALLPEWQQPYGVCSPAYGPWTIDLNGMADFCPNFPECNDGYVDINLVEEINFGGLRLTAGDLGACTIQNTVANSAVKSITLNGSGGPLTLNGVTSLGAEAFPQSISGSSGPQSFTAVFPPNTLVFAPGVPQFYTATSATFHSQPDVLGQFYQVCIETTLLPQMSFKSFQSIAPNLPPDCLTLTCPTNVIVNATSEAGAIFTFSPSGATRCGSNVVITCEPPSGSFFPPGLSVVHCSAIDSQGSQDECRFLVTVNPPLRLRATAVRPDLIELRWTGDAVPEFADSLSDRVPWRELTGRVESDGDERVLRIAPTGNRGFFRLRQP